MATLEDLPTQILQRIVDSAHKGVRGIPLTRWFLALRRVCRKFNTCIQHAISSLPDDGGNSNLFPAAGKLKLLDLVLNQDATDESNRMVLAIRRAREYAIQARAGGDAAALGDSIMSIATREQYSRAITNVVFRTIHLRYTESLPGVVQGIEQTYQFTSSENEAHALAVLAAAQEGDVAMLEALLSQDTHFNPSPVFLSLFPGPLSQAIRGYHTDAVKVLLARFESHGDVDRPDAPNAEGDYSLHLAARLGSIPLVKLLLAHPLSPSVNIISYTYPAARMTPLDAAASAGHLDLVKYLFTLPDVWRTGLGGQYGGQYGGKTPIYYAVENQSTEMIKFLLAQPETLITTYQVNFSPLWRATDLGRLDLVELLVEQGRAGSNAELLATYQACLDLAIGKGNAALFDFFIAKEGIRLETRLLSGAVVSGRREIFEKLVTRREFDSNARRHALSRAAAKGNLHMMQRLIDEGNLDLKSAGPLFPRIALSWARGRAEVIELLKRTGIVPQDAEPLFSRGLY